MKILRTELETGLNRKFFEIPVNTLGLNDLKFFQNTISGEISSEKTNIGFHLKGHLNIPFIEVCDCCLAEFQQDKESNIEIILTADLDIFNDENNENILHFPDNAEFIDLKQTLYEEISLEDPIKKICRPDCKGLCAYCGTDLNVSSCDCTENKSETDWNVLKKLQQ